MGIVVLQRGHVPRTSGATGARGEQQYAIAAADATAEELRKIGHVARIIDADVSDHLYRGDLFFALHWDGNPNPTISGASVGYQTPEGGALSRLWKHHYKNNGWTRYFRADNYTPALAGYYGVRKAVAQGNRRAIITEAGFVTNSHDEAMMSPHLTAVAITATVVDTLGAQCPPGEPPAGILPFPGTVSFGARGEAVKAWQRAFNSRGNTLAVDGIFGNATRDAVVHWQTHHGLHVDGIAGPMTWHSVMTNLR